MEDFIEWLSENRQNKQFCFIMDSLNIHGHPVILDFIEQRWHRVVFCALYWSCGGPIEYIFNTIHVHLQMTEAPMSGVEDFKTGLDDKYYFLFGRCIILSLFSARWVSIDNTRTFNCN